MRRAIKTLVLACPLLLGGLTCHGGATLRMGDFLCTRIEDGWRTNIQQYAATASYSKSQGFSIYFHGSTQINGPISSSSYNVSCAITIAGGADVTLVENSQTAIRASGNLELSGPGSLNIVGLGSTSQAAIYAPSIKITGGLSLAIAEVPGRYSHPGTSICAHNGDLSIYESFVTISGYGPCLWSNFGDVKVVGSMVSLMEHPSKSIAEYSVAAISGELTIQGCVLALNSPVIGIMSAKRMMIVDSCVAAESDRSCFNAWSESVWFDNAIVTAASEQGNVACVGNRRQKTPGGNYLVRLGDGLYDFETGGDYPCVSGGQIFVEGADLRCCAPNSSAMSSWDFYMKKGTLEMTSKLSLENSYRTMMTEAAVSSVLLKSGAIEAWGGVHNAFLMAMATQFLNALETEPSGRANAAVAADDFVQTGGEIVQGDAKVGADITYMYVCGGFTVGSARTPAFTGGIFNGSFATIGKESIATSAKTYDFDNPYYLSPTNAAGQTLVRVDYEPYWVVEGTPPPVRQISVTYRPGADGVGSEQSVQKDYGVPLPLAGALFTRNDYEQVGWSTVDGGELQYGLSLTYEGNESLVLYPVWKALGKLCEITFVWADSMSDISSHRTTIERRVGEKFGAVPTPSYPGHVFRYWTLDSPYGDSPDCVGCGGEFADAHVTSETVVTGNVTYYALWEKSPTEPDEPFESTGIALTLSPGWNWLSLDVAPTNATLSAVFSGVAFADEDMVKSADGVATYYGGSWYGDLTALKPGVAYMVKKSTAGAATVAVTGVAAETSVAVTAGWNWIGCTATEEVLLDALGHSGGFSDDDMISSADAVATYYGGKWYGELKAIKPGVGYKVKFAKAGVLTFGKVDK